MRGGILCLLVVAGCVEPAVVECDDGRLCPGGTVCVDDPLSCAVPAGCPDADDGTPCTYPGVDDGVCHGGACFPAGCGNEIVEPGEACDDGNTDDHDDCANSCMSNNTCGNGVVDFDEQCEPSIDARCRADCTSPVCGDGTTDATFFEACDDAGANADVPNVPDVGGAPGCRTNCQPRRCGDGILDDLYGELCDDGNLFSDDGCSFDCQSIEVCGNGYTDFVLGEVCDDGNLASHDGCLSCVREDPTWSALVPTAPSARIGAALAYDAGRQRVVLYGGYDDGLVGETWVWDGGAWTELELDAPGPREEAAMAYDAAHDRIVMFGGATPAGVSAETWLFDGHAWTSVTPAHVPPARYAATIAYDPTASRLVMFGGETQSGELGDTWTWDGTDWTDATPASSPEPREHAMMAYQPGTGVVLFGGFQGPPGFGGVVYADTWAWAAGAWTQVVNDFPPARWGAVMAYDEDAGRLVLFGGNLDGPASEDPIPDVWTLVGSDWVPLDTVAQPLTRAEASGTFDAARGELVVFGGWAGPGKSAETWVLDDLTWSQPSTREPSVWLGTAMAFDSHRGEVVLFGGYDTDERGDTWVHDTHWRIAATTGPSARTGAALAEDPDRGVLVLFGGHVDNTYFADTWEWDGATWTPKVGGPEPRRLLLCHFQRRSAKRFTR